MFKLFSSGFWETVARLILRNRFIILFLVVLVTGFFGMQWNKMRFTYTEANLLPDDHPINLEYNNFLDIFGEEGNLIVMGVKDSTLLTVDKLNAWNTFSESFSGHPSVEGVEVGVVVTGVMLPQSTAAVCVERSAGQVVGGSGPQGIVFQDHASCSIF